MIDNLAEWEETATTNAESIDEGGAEEESEPKVVEVVKFSGQLILCAGARGNLDDAAAAMLVTLLERRGAEVRVLLHESMQTAQLRRTDLGEPAVAILSYMNADSLAHARFLVRRVRRRWPKTKVILGFWASPTDDGRQRDPLAATRADRVVTSLEETILAISEILAGEGATVVPWPDKPGTETATTTA